jgi:dipeptidase D
MNIRDLKPALIWGIFDEITRVPRPSKKEGKIRQYLLDFAAKHSIAVKTDEIGNVVMTRPATPGHENAPTVILQGHMDMVCESNKPFDFENNPITTIIDGEWVHADGTTLGADNGIGMAAALSVMVDKDLVTGPVEALFTVDEETGMTGANNLGEGMLNGQILLNLDSEDDAEIFVGCAGGIDTECIFHCKSIDAPADYAFFTVELTGGLGGHSGGDIHRGHANANQLLCRFLNELELAGGHVVIANIDGGNLRNAIPRAASATFGIEASLKHNVMTIFNEYVATIADEYEGLETTMKLNIQSADKPAKVVDAADSLAVIRSTYSAPHGVISMSRELEGLVETSTNLASIKMPSATEIVVTTSQRSSVESRKLDIAHRVAAHFRAAGAEVKHGDGYPGWKPNMNSRIMHIASDAYEELYGIKPAIKAIHAGLECGLILKKYPGLDMASFGPTLRGVHSPSEKMHIPAVERFWAQLSLILQKVADIKE